jgi:hypothetical protein
MHEENIMKKLGILFLIFIELLIVSSVVFAGDFDWISDFNFRAESDPSGFRARLEARFRVGDMEIKTVLGNVHDPADAYILLRLGEISNQPIDHVIERYKTVKGSGWGVIAKSLGIKPGSKDFHALKQAQDLYDDNERGSGKAKGKGKGQGKK